MTCGLDWKEMEENEVFSQNDAGLGILRKVRLGALDVAMNSKTKTDLLPVQ